MKTLVKLSHARRNAAAAHLGIAPEAHAAALASAAVDHGEDWTLYDATAPEWIEWRKKLGQLPPLPAPPPQPIEPMPFEKWPPWAKRAAKHRTDEDVGVGDTAKRIAAKFGGDTYIKMREAIGFPCRCEERREEWNRRYPYSMLGAQGVAALTAAPL